MNNPEPQGTTQPQEPVVSSELVRPTVEKTQTANKWVWYIATLAMELWASGKRREPVVGDMVVETTHILGLARHKLGLESAVGELMKIEVGEHGKKYVLKTLAGELSWWENCLLVPLDSPNDRTERPEAEHGK